MGTAAIRILPLGFDALCQTIYRNMQAFAVLLEYLE
jgi:hypothetical protein